MAITCPPGTFSIQTLLLYFRHSHWLLFVLSFIVLSRDQGFLISGGRNARGKIMWLSFWQIFSILQPCNLNLFYRFRPSFCVLFVFWLDLFLDIFVITLHTQRNNTTWQLHLWLSNWAVFNREMGCSISRPWPLHVQGHRLQAAMFLIAPVLSPIVLQPSEVCSPNGPSWLFAPFTRLTAHLYWCGSTNLYSRHSAWLDGAGKRSCQNHPVDQRSPKGPSLQISWRTSISWGSAPTYRTQRTFSLLHLHSSVQPPTPGWSARKRLDLPAGSQSKV